MTKLNKEQKIAAAIAAKEAELATRVAALPSNNDVSAIGAKAVERWENAETQKGAGDANGIFAVLNAHFTMTFDFVVQRKKEDTSESYSCSILDYLNEGMWKHSDGTNDSSKKSAAVVAICQKLFGIADPTPALKQSIFRRCIPAAAYILRELPEVTELHQLLELVSLDTVEIGKTKDGLPISVEMLSLPRHLILDAPKEDASKNEKLMFEATKGVPIQLDGSQGNSIKTLAEKAAPKRAASAPAAKPDAGATLVTSVALVSSVLKGWNDPEAETELAPNNAMRTALWSLAQDLAAYFAAYPAEADEEIANAA